MDHHLKLRHNGTYIRWSGNRGMSWYELIADINDLLGLKPPPDLLILHAGGNDCVSIPTDKLCARIENDIKWLHNTLPACTIVWSDILTRNKYRGCSNIQAMERKRKRVNREGRKAALDVG
ncbi:hypothetical protein KP79_PYT24554 [Mizuhopecten yessoensis]|uniref:SGNH hydrolase-type esterase domain-containing protein n=1 Tax=Mizuhopecten yessoensis TaxID=6573 RepID=A0A210Q137_MIZYE|nr:hypothetical protein KP79_PYT24554 [Mizuhopecten yessoensis]